MAGALGACHMTLFRTTGLLSALALMGFVGWLNFQQISEAYGSGPPYYGRTVNMDKWTNPLPGLLMIDVVIVLVAAAGVQMFRRRREERAAVEEILQD
jgi:hypothetical protein